MTKTVVIIGAVALGLAVIYVVSQSAGMSYASSGLKNDTGNVWGFLGKVLATAEKAVPHWFEPDPTDENLNRYPSSSGFVDHGSEGG